MRCGPGHRETRPRSPRSPPPRSVRGPRPSLRPTRSWPWPLQPTPVSPLAGRPLTRLRARFKSNVSAPAPTSRCRSATVTDRERSTSTFRRSEEHTSELQSPCNLVCRLLLEKKKTYDWEGVNPDGYFLDKLEPIPSALPSFQKLFQVSATASSIP